ncbi:MAG: TerB family tellurite resistance protein [Vicinamibacteria bacterium]
MIDALLRFFRSEVAPATSAPAEADREHALRAAAAVLLFEVARADGSVDEAERTVLRAALRSAFELSPAETDDLARLAEEQSRSAVSLYEFTQLVDTELDAAAKKRIVELLWLVTFADARKDAHEEHLVRRIAGLLHVDHPDFIDAKLRARARSGGGHSTDRP